MGQRGQFGQIGLFRETHDLKIGGMRHHKQRGVVVHRRREVRQRRAVGCADLHQPRAGLGHHVRDAEAAADLDELPPANHAAAPLGEGHQNQEQGRRVVVHYQRGLRPGDVAHDPFGVYITFAARAGFQVIFERGVARRHRLDRLDRRVTQRGAPQVGVDDHAGGIDHGAQGGCAAAVEQFGGPVNEGHTLRGRGAFTDGLPRILQRVPQGQHDLLAAIQITQRRRRVGVQQRIHARQGAQSLVQGVSHGLPRQSMLPSSARSRSRRYTSITTKLRPRKNATGGFSTRGICSHAQVTANRPNQMPWRRITPPGGMV